MKLIRLFGIFVLISLILGVGSAFNGTSTETVDEQVEQGNVQDNDISFSVGKKESIVENPDKQESTSIINENNSYVDSNSTNIVKEQKEISNQKKDETIAKESYSDNEQVNLTDNNISINKEPQNNESISEEKNNSREENNKQVEQSNTKKESEKIEENENNSESIIEEEISNQEIEQNKNVLEIDEEYEKLKKLYKYKNGTECYYASLKAYSKTYNENYKNAGCISGAYNGELLGYRIIIYFVDGTSMYYDEAVE